MHSSKMSHQHSSGEAGVYQVSPTAANTLNIGTKNVFQEGAGRKGRVLEGTSTQHPRQSQKGHLQARSYKVGQSHYG